MSTECDACGAVSDGVHEPLTHSPDCPYVMAASLRAELAAIRASRDALAEALARLFAAADESGAVLAASEDDLCAAANDMGADPIVREQAAAVLQCRAVLAGHAKGEAS
jgi:hypothetical protein